MPGLITFIIQINPSDSSIFHTSINRVNLDANLKHSIFILVRPRKISILVSWYHEVLKHPGSSRMSQQLSNISHDQA